MYTEAVEIPQRKVNMKPAMLSFKFDQNQMEILIEALRAYKCNNLNDEDAVEEAEDMFQAFEAQLGWALTK